MVDAVCEQGSVWEPRYAIVEGRAAECRLEPSGLAKVTNRDDVRRLAIGKRDLPPFDLDRECRPVLGPGHDLERTVRFGAESVNGGHRLGRREVERRPSN